MPFEKSLLKTTRSTYAACLSLFLAGCALPSPNFAQTSTSQKSVAFISLLPEGITMWHLGFTAFQNHQGVLPLEFDANALATQTALSLLTPHYQIKSINVDNATLLAGVHNRYSFLDRIAGTEGIVEDELKAAVKPGQADLIVVLDGSEPPEDANFLSENYIGVGLVSRSYYAPAFVSPHGGIVGLYVTLEIYDGTTFQELARGDGAVTPNDGVTTLNWRGEPYTSLSPTQKTDLEAVEKRVLTDYITTALPAIHLIPASPP